MGLASNLVYRRFHRNIRKLTDGFDTRIEVPSFPTLVIERVANDMWDFRYEDKHGKILFPQIIFLTRALADDLPIAEAICYNDGSKSRLPFPTWDESGEPETVNPIERVYLRHVCLRYFGELRANGYFEVQRRCKDEELELLS